MSTLVHANNTQHLSLLFPPSHQYRSSASSSSPTSASSTSSTGGGILLNSSSRSPSSSPANRIKSLPGHNYHDNIPENSHYGTTRSLPVDRKIRFAPLPDPRRLSESDDDSESDDRSPTSSTTPEVVVSEPLQSASSNEDEGDREVRSESKRWKKNFLKPFVSPVRSAFSEDTNKLGLNLFRAASRDSFNSATGSEQDTVTEPPSRFRTSFSNEQRPTVASPTNTTYNNVLRPTISADASVPTAKKLLNGRVYGGRKSISSNREYDHREPEFVEWGYGGMGSVKSGERFYDKVQSGGSAITSGSHDEEDDGSGMGWVRRRRAERERREREERERQEKEQAKAVPGIEVHSPPQTPLEEKHARPNMASMSSSSTLLTSPVHDTTVVAIPHHHQHHPRRQTSGTVTPTPTIGRKNSDDIEAGKAKQKEPLHISTAGLAMRGKDEQIVSSPSSDGDDDGSSSSGEEDEDDSAESEADESRRTCKCAGMEKVSRHKG